MNPDTLLAVKDLITIWLLGGNGLLLAWPLVLYLRRRPLSPIYGTVLVLIQALVLLQAALGVTLLGLGLRTNAGHLMYGVLNGALAVFRILAHGPLLRAGPGGLLWLAGLAALAVGLAARSSVTAFGGL